MGKILPFNRNLRRKKVKECRVYFNRSCYASPTDLLREFVDDKNACPSGMCSQDWERGNYDIAFREDGESVSVNFKYDGVLFTISKDHPRSWDIVDLFTKYLSEKKIAWELSDCV